MKRKFAPSSTLYKTEATPTSLLSAIKLINLNAQKLLMELI